MTTEPTPTPVPDRWGVVAIIESIQQGGWTSYREVPTFEVNSHISGVVTEGQAYGAAREVIAAILGVPPRSLDTGPSPGFPQAHISIVSAYPDPTPTTGD